MNTSNAGSLSRGPGAPSGWYWYVRIGRISCRSPSTDPSFRLRALTRNPESEGIECSSIWNSWFCDVMTTLPVRRSCTGWFAPWWPNGSRDVVAPIARPTSWWPRQIPRIGRARCVPRCAAASSRVRVVAATCGIAAGSPGPFEMTIPSGDHERTSRAVDVAGNTRTVAPSRTRHRIWFSFTPVSRSATFGPLPDWRASPVDSTTSGFAASGSVACAFATASRAMSGSCDRWGGTCRIAPRSVPFARSRRTSARVSIPRSPGTPYDRR